MDIKVSDVSWRKTVILYHLFGLLGVHRFFVGKTLTGLLWLFTGGGFCVGAIVDGIMLYTGNFTDENGALVLPDWKRLLLRTISHSKVSAHRTEQAAVASAPTAPIRSVPAEGASPRFTESPSKARASEKKTDGTISLYKASLPEVASLASGEYVVLDTETTGLSAQNDKIIEIALLKVSGGKIVDEYCTLVNPQQHIGSRASEINGIYDDDVKDAPLYDEVGEKTAEFLGNCTIVGHNIKFDLGFMGGLLKSVTLDQDLTWKYIDTIDVAKRAYPGERNYKLQTLVQSLGIETDGAHRAKSDALATWKLFDLCNEKLSMPDELYDEAVKVVREAGSASAAMLQRSLNIGYSRAARIIDAMEERGVVGPFEGAKPRRVLQSSQLNQ